MKDKINDQEKINLIRENLINTYCDYYYIIDVGRKTKKQRNYDDSRLDSYVIFINQILEMSKRDFINCSYKLLVDKKSFGFNSFCELMLDAYSYKVNDWYILDPKVKKDLKIIRNNYLSHSSIGSSEIKIILLDIFKQILVLIDKYNEAVKSICHDKLISDYALSEMQRQIKTGVDQMFENNSHRKVYGD